MSEAGEGGGLRGLWKKVSGQTAREAVAKTAALEEQNRQQQEIEARNKRLVAGANNLAATIRSATHVDRGLLPEDLDVNETVQTLAGQVTARSIYGKFPAEVKIKDQVFHPKPTNDFQDYGDEQAGAQRFRDQFPNASQPLQAMITLLYGGYGLSPDFVDDLAKKHLLTVINVPDTGDALITYLFAQRWRDARRRAAPFAVMSFRLGKESAYQLLDLVRKEPDVAEMFLQTVAEGFEAKPDTLETAGIPRVRSDEVVIVNLDKVNPRYFNDYVNPDTNKLNPSGKIGGGFFDMVGGKLSQALVQNQNGEVERFTYSIPHGVVEPDQIPK